MIKAKYKVGIENYEFLAVSKKDGNELVYVPGTLKNLKQYLTREGIKADNPLDYFTIIQNPYKNIQKCHCRLCDVAYKDPTNKSGQLTTHIEKAHNLSINGYIEQFPEDSHLFEYKMKFLKQEDESLSEAKERVQCPLCGKYFKAIRNTHTVNKHGMTMEEFVKATGMKETLSEATKDIAREIYEANDKMYKKTDFIERENIKQYTAGVDYYTFDYSMLTQAGKHFIYKLTAPSGRIYIGRTNDFFERMLEHCSNAKKGDLNYALYHAIRKYEWENFTKEIIDIAENKGDAAEKELKWINFFDSYDNGYNNTKYTSGGFDWSEYKGTEKYDNFLKAIKEKASGKNHYNYGKKMSEETRKKMTESRKGQFTLPWFQKKYGEVEGQIKYEERSCYLKNRPKDKCN